MEKKRSKFEKHYKKTIKIYESSINEQLKRLKISPKYPFLKNCTSVYEMYKKTDLVELIQDALSIISQLYHSKFLFGDSLKSVDDNFTVRK